MIFQNFGFNQNYPVAAAVAGAVFPNQATQVWTGTETAQWLSAASSVFTVGNGVTYGSPTSVSTALGSDIFSGCLARNGKIYMAGDNGTSTVYIWNTNTSTMSTLSLSANPGAYASAVYNDYSKCVYLPGNNKIFVIDTLTDTEVTTIANPLGTAYCLVYGSGYDARYIYGNGWFLNNTWFKIDCNNNTAATTGQSTGGDTLSGMMADNGKLYMGGGGGSTSGFHVWNANNDTNGFVSSMGNISDKYRGAATYYDGYLYTLPANNTTSNVWKITPSTNTASIVTTATYVNFLQGYIMGADGLIYGFGNPSTSSNNAMVYDPTTNTISYITVPQINCQWAVIDGHGDIYFAQSTNLYKMAASNVPTATANALAEMNGVISRMR